MKNRSTDHAQVHAETAKALSVNDFYLDISVKKFNGHFTREAGEHGVSVKIMLKVPKADLTTVRLTGSNWAITEFLRTLASKPDSSWTEKTVQMHVNAMKPERKHQ